MSEDACAVWREALSSVHVGGEPGIDQRLLDAHLRRCDDCQAFAELVRGSRPATDTDLAARVVHSARQADRERAGAARWLLAVVAVQVIVFAVGDLLSDGDDAHGIRHLGAFSIAYAVGLLGVVWRPARARTMLPVATVLAAALAITAAIDVARGHAPLVGEALHLSELASVGLIWWMAVPSGPDGRPSVAFLRRGRRGG